MEKKEYEIKDHLGNVLVAITDFKQPIKETPQNTLHKNGTMAFL